MRAGRGGLHRDERVAVPCDRSVLQIEDHLQKQLSLRYIVLYDRDVVGGR